jgi:hypothetical protein
MPVSSGTVFQVITGGALQTIGKFDNTAEASAAAGILGRPHKNGSIEYKVVSHQLRIPTNK